MKGVVLVVIMLALCLAQEEQLTYISSEQTQNQNVEQLIDTFSHKQDEILKKVFTHFIEQQVKKWRKSHISDSVIRERVLDLVIGRNQDLYLSLKKFVEDKLFTKLDMHLLIESLQKEIRLNPQNYYLTFEVYDLLID